MNDLINSCLRKQRYDEAGAEARLAEMLAMPDCKEPDRLRCYKCTFCHGYHVGHLPLK